MVIGSFRTAADVYCFAQIPKKLWSASRISRGKFWLRLILMLLTVASLFLSREAPGIIRVSVHYAEDSDFPGDAIVRNSIREATNRRYLKNLCVIERSLQPNSVMMYRESIPWGRYGAYVLAGTMLLLVQSGFIVYLILQTRRRKRSDQTIRNLTRRLISAGEDERRHIARELHDDLGQRLSLLSVQLGSFNHLPATEYLDSRPNFSDSLQELNTLISDVHDLSHRLHSSKLEHLGLAAALKEMCQQLSHRHGIQINLHASELPADLSRDMSLCFYRIAQESLNNAVKHSYASRVTITLTADTRKLRMQIRDFGSGFEAATPRAGLGLVTMEERLRIIAGRLTIFSKLGEGTTVTAEAPRG
jgi:signal transduction histidine kinase